MKKILIIMMLVMLAGCSGDPSEKSSVIELDVSDSSAISAKRVQGKISTVGEVDLYKVNLAETGRILQVRCTSDTLNPDVDLLVNVYEKDASGNMNMVAGNHAPDNGKFGADIEINLYVDKPKELYINVRDLQDNDSSDNPYYISANYEAAPDGNGTFATALPVSIDGDATREAIGTIGDVDCFGFTVSSDGVYDVLVNFTPMPGTGVRLSLDLFAGDGSLVETRKPGGTNTSHMVHYLTAGEYKLVVGDEGKDDFDSSSIYEVSISQKDSVAEIKTNDTPDTAVAASSDSFSGASTDYYEDADWYTITTSSSADINIMELSFQSDISMNYNLELYKLADTGLDEFDFLTASSSFSHTYRGGSDTPYVAVLKLDKPADGEKYYLVVRPADGSTVAGNSPYTASVTMSDVSDADENGTGNDIDSNAIDLTTNPGANANHEGKIAYRGDVDWFKVTIPFSADDRVFSVYLDIPDTPEVEYAMDIKRDNRDGEDSSYGITKRVINGSTDHRTVDLKTSFVVKGQETDENGYTDATYYIKVYDFQNDDGDESAYQLKWYIDDIPSAISSVPAPVTSPLYNDEKLERTPLNADYDSEEVTIDYTDGSTGSFKTNNHALDFANATSSTDGEGVTTITFPWIGGYIDYLGDEDWYSLDLSNPYVETDQDWYYTINVEMYSAGSEVEYIWEYMPDSNHDRKVHANRCSGTARHCSGVQASSGDTDVAVSELNNSFPGSDDSVLWLGSLDGSYSWKGVSFFRIYDFNFMNLSNGNVNTNPDGDWGYDAPYFFRVTLKFYQGTEKP